MSDMDVTWQDLADYAGVEIADGNMGDAMNIITALYRRCRDQDDRLSRLWADHRRPLLSPPPEPTPEQCSAKDKVDIPGRPDTVAHSVWWPQMGGYTGKAVITIGDCSTLWLWHDGQFPFRGDDREPREIHLCDYGQWVDMFQWLNARYDEEFNDGPEPYRLDLPEGVTREEAEDVHRKVLAWGMWTPDPGGFVIRTFEEWMAARMPCIPIPCPPFVDTQLGVFERIVPPLPAPYVEFTGVVHPGPGARFAPDATLTGPFDGYAINEDGSATVTGMRIGVDPSATGDTGLSIHTPPQVGDAPEGAPRFTSAHYTVHKDGSVETSTWTAEDVLHHVTPPQTDVAAILDDPRQHVHPVYPNESS